MGKNPNIVPDALRFGIQQIKNHWNFPFNEMASCLGDSLPYLFGGRVN